jgi:hypothetical protein
METELNEKKKADEIEFLDDRFIQSMNRSTEDYSDIVDTNKHFDKIEHLDDESINIIRRILSE